MLKTDLDRSIVPINPHADIYSNYIFYNTPDAVISQIEALIDFQSDVEIDSYSTTQASRQFSRKKVTANAINNSFIQDLIQNSSSAQMWTIYLIPFLPKDLHGVIGLGGSPDSVSISLRTSINILLSNLFSFIVQRKIRESPSLFHISEFFDFLYSSLRDIIVFTEDDKKEIQKKLVLFLNHVCKLTRDKNIILIESDAENWNQFLIKVKNTSTLSSRITNIQADLYSIIDSERKQKKLDSFF